MNDAKRDVEHGGVGWMENVAYFGQHVRSCVLLPAARLFPELPMPGADGSTSSCALLTWCIVCCVGAVCVAASVAFVAAAMSVVAAMVASSVGFVAAAMVGVAAATALAVACVSVVVAIAVIVQAMVRTCARPAIQVAFACVLLVAGAAALAVTGLLDVLLEWLVTADMSTAST